MNSRPFDLIAGSDCWSDCCRCTSSVPMVDSDASVGRALRCSPSWFARGRSVMFDGLVLGASSTSTQSDVGPRGWHAAERRVSQPAHQGPISLELSRGTMATMRCPSRLFLTLYGGRKLAVASWIVTLVCTLPRVIASTHWLTDVLIGSFVCSALTVAAFWATPLGQHTVRDHHRRESCAFGRLKTGVTRLPLLDSQGNPCW